MSFYGGLAILVVVAIAFVAPAQGYYLNIMMQAATYAIAVAGIVIVLGYCGQLALCQAAFLGIGAYCVALGT
ncbi:MAG TPA: ABC transporter, partial [Rhizobium sp.]